MPDTGTNVQHVFRPRPEQDEREGEDQEERGERDHGEEGGEEVRIITWGGGMSGNVRRAQGSSRLTVVVQWMDKYFRNQLSWPLDSTGHPLNKLWGVGWLCGIFGSRFVVNINFMVLLEKKQLFVDVD